MPDRHRWNPEPVVALDAKTVRKLLAELGRRLRRRGAHVDIYIVGGAAVALLLDERRVTADVDAIFSNPELVQHEAAAVARKYGLPDNWLSNRAAMFLPGGNDLGAVCLDVEGLTVSVASPEHVLAMKMASFRPGKDQDDLELLFKQLGIQTPERAADIALSVYGPDTVVLPDRQELILSARSVIERMQTKQTHRRKRNRT
jgi:Nucleotidyltransferase of unknown function (DUF6036)